MRSEGVSFEQALNDAIRQGLSGSSEPCSTPVFSMGVPVLDLTKALQLAGELEDEHLATKMRRGA